MLHVWYIILGISSYKWFFQQTPKQKRWRHHHTCFSPVPVFIRKPLPWQQMIPVCMIWSVFVVVCDEWEISGKKKNCSQWSMFCSQTHNGWLSTTTSCWYRWMNVFDHNSRLFSILTDIQFQLRNLFTGSNTWCVRCFQSVNRFVEIFDVTSLLISDNFDVKYISIPTAYVSGWSSTSVFFGIIHEFYFKESTRFKRQNFRSPNGLKGLLR